jgi:hypothetical protein
MLDSLTTEEIDEAYAGAAKRRLMDDKDLTRAVVELMYDNNLIPEELINEFKYPKEMEEPTNETTVTG